MRFINYIMLFITNWSRRLGLQKCTNPECTGSNPPYDIFLLDFLLFFPCSVVGVLLLILTRIVQFTASKLSNSTDHD